MADSWLETHILNNSCYFIASSVRGFIKSQEIKGKYKNYTHIKYKSIHLRCSYIILSLSKISNIFNED